MNIFILSLDPIEAAQYMCDKHVVKLLLESTQILSTVSGGPYKPTHANHPCTLWAAESLTNYTWLLIHALALSEEYTFRYGKIHKCASILLELPRKPAQITAISRTPHVQCMPVELRGDCPVEAYRRYYRTKTFAQWNRTRPPPDWW